MIGSGRDDIRRLLKEFGVKVDETVLLYLSKNEDLDALHVRLSLEDLTDYGTSPPDPPLELTIEGTIKRGA